MNVETPRGTVHGQSYALTFCGRFWTSDEPPNVGARRMWGWLTTRPITCKHCLGRVRRWAQNPAPGAP